MLLSGHLVSVRVNKCHSYNILSNLWSNQSKKGTPQTNAIHFLFGKYMCAVLSS